MGRPVLIIGAILLLIGCHAAALWTPAATWSTTTYETGEPRPPTGCLDGLLDGRRWADIAFVDYDALRQVGVLTADDEVDARDGSDPASREVWQSIEEDRAIVLPFFLDQTRLGYFGSSSVGISDMRCAVSSKVDSLSIVRLTDRAAIDHTHLMSDAPLYVAEQDDVLTVSLWEPLIAPEPSSSADEDDRPPAEWHDVMLSALLDAGAVEGVLIQRSDGARGVGAIPRKDGVTIRFVWEVDGAPATELEALAAVAVATSDLTAQLQLEAAMIEARSGLVVIDVPSAHGFDAVQDAFSPFDSLISGPPPAADRAQR